MNPVQIFMRLSWPLAILVVCLNASCDRSPQEGPSRSVGPTATQTASLGPRSSPVPVDLAQGWCGGHGVPESVCTRCDASLIPKFKEAGDWCAEHGLPESQCTICNPQVREKWAALRPRSPESGLREGESGMRLEPNPRLLTGANDPLCQVDTLRIRFVDASIVRKAGIETAPAKRRRMSATIGVPAEVEFDATRVTRVTARLAGVVLETPINLGDHVETADLLAVIDSPTLGEAKSRYIERWQDHVLAKADSERVQTIFEGVRRMLAVCTPTASATELRERLEGVLVGAAKAQLLRAHAAFQLARADAAREAQLLDKKISSEKDFQTAQSALAAAEAGFVAMREEIAFSSERDRLAAKRAFQVTKAALEAAERQLHILGLSDEQVARIGTEPNELLSRYELRSPAAGRVIERHVTTGEAVGDSDVLFVVADGSTMWLLADVYERDLLQLREGLPLLFTVDGLPGASFEGRLSWISSSVDDRTRTVPVRAELPNHAGLLRARMFGRALIVIHENSDVLSVPAQAVQTDGCCQLVFVRQADDLFVPRKITLGASANGFVEVLTGLSEGDMVATTGSYLMKTEILKSNIGAGCCEVDPGR